MDYQCLQTMAMPGLGRINFRAVYQHSGDHVEGRIIAFRTFQIGTIGFNVYPKVAEIGSQRLYVNEDYRGRGVGTKLAELACRYAKRAAREEKFKLEKLEASTTSSSTHAQKIFRGLGFRRVGKSKRIYCYEKRL